MLEKFRKFLEKLFKGSDSGITQSGKGQEVTKKAENLLAEQVEKVEKIDSPYGTYDPTTKPGEVKPQGEIITPEGDLETRIYSYNPESFTDTQKRLGTGSYSDDALRERYIEEGADETMTLDEFAIQERGYGYPASVYRPDAPQIEGTSMADLIADDTFKGDEFDDIFEKMQADPINKMIVDDLQPAVTEQALLFKNPFIEQLSKATGRSEQQIKEAIVENYNAGYAPNDPKRISIDDEEAIERLIDVNVNYGEQTRQGFVDDIVEAVVEKDMMENTGLGQIQKDLTKKSKETSEQLALVRSQSMDVKKMLEQIGVDTSSVDFNILANSNDMDAVLAEAKKLKEIMDPLQGGQMEELARSGNLDKVMEASVDQAEIDMGRAVEMAERAATPGEVDQARKILEEVKAAFFESLKTGVYKSPFGRTLNAEGGRIGFKDGNKFPTSRRDFLKMLAAGVGTLFAPKGVAQVAEMVAKSAPKAIPLVDGMPMWFPALVNKIRTQGTVVRKPDYADFTSGGDTEIVYVLKDKSLAGGEIRLYENEATGAVSVTGRGDEFQQVSLDFTPGENKVMTDQLGQRGVVTEKPTFDASAQTQSAARAEEKGGFLGNKDTTDDLMGQQSVNVNEKGTFEAGEFAKGERYDIENFGGIDDLQGGVTSWSKLVKSPEKKMEEKAKKFLEEQVNPDVIDDFAKGGRVGYKQGGGVGTLFKRKIA
jgi:hypothetical protein